MNGKGFGFLVLGAILGYVGGYQSYAQLKVPDQIARARVEGADFARVRSLLGEKIPLQRIAEDINYYDFTPEDLGATSGDFTWILHLPTKSE